MNNHAVQSSEKPGSPWKAYVPAIISFIALMAGIVLDNWVSASFFTGWIRLAWYIVAYIPVGWPVLKKAAKTVARGDIFTEFFLMGIATLGAFAIGEYPEGVAVMLFYTVGELFQQAAVNRARRNIRALLDFRPETARVRQGDKTRDVPSEKVNPGDIISVRPGEKVPLDGEMLTEIASFNTAALTGESAPATIRQGETVLAGMILLDKPAECKVSRPFSDSSLSRILKMVQEAASRKARTEQFIRRFARIYTPVVFFLAVALVILPVFFADPYVFSDWLYRALVFLVISCPCALVISIPLGYFGGIGAASRNGILFKGSNFLDLMTRVNTVVMDKTGTLTKGVFAVQEVRTNGRYAEKELLAYAAALEKHSTHPVAKAVVAYSAGKIEGTGLEAREVEEISGQGLTGKVDGVRVLAGSQRLMETYGIGSVSGAHAAGTVVFIGIDGKLGGFITVADELKEDSAEAVAWMHDRQIQTVVLSGDRQEVVDQVARDLGISEAYGGLLPEDKVRKLEALKQDKMRVVAFAGDGINDTPVLAVSDVGIAMGALGSDAAVETADVVIQTDHLSRIGTAVQIGKATSRIVWQNIGLAFGVKLIVLIMGAGGLATMWGAVFADVGVALLAILNAVRIQHMKSFEFRV